MLALALFGARVLIVKNEGEVWNFQEMMQRSFLSG
jgi:hypothetical protein